MLQLQGDTETPTREKIFQKLNHKKLYFENIWPIYNDISIKGKIENV